MYISSKLFDIGRQNCAQIKALENIFQIVTNFFMFEQNLSESIKKSVIIEMKGEQSSKKKTFFQSYIETRMLANDFVIPDTRESAGM